MRVGLWVGLRVRVGVQVSMPEGQDFYARMAVEDVHGMVRNISLAAEPVKVSGDSCTVLNAGLTTAARWKLS